MDSRKRGLKMAKVKAFLKGLNEVLDGLRAAHREAMEGTSFADEDCLADTRVLSAKDELARMGFDGAKVALTYDGAGYDYLSHNADANYDCLLADAAEEFGFDLAKARENEAKRKGPRERMRELAEACGLFMEDYSSWAVCFYEN